MVSLPNVPVPVWLETPPPASVNPPVAPRPQDLPFDQLTWEAFEKLCLRLVRVDSNVEHCQLYGTRGQDQEGIDFYARDRHTGEYRVYQCKRESGFGPAKIRDAVEIFLAGKWADRAKVFVLCTTESLVPTERAEEFERQFDSLQSKGVKFKSWSADQLSGRLKDFPEIVDDFFSREWAVAFCGEDKVRRLGDRLDVKAVAEFRQLFAALYLRVFNKHDPGLPLIGIANGHDVLSFHDRYVLPDIQDRQVLVHYGAQADSANSRSTGPVDAEPRESIDGRAGYHVRTTSSYQVAHSLENWLRMSDRFVLLAGTGSGKSALLRFVAADVLSDSPCLPALAEKWGQHLPIWVPFALWAKKVADPSTSHFSLSDLLREWLHSWDEDRLWPLVERVLEDKRVLLLVDGLDEWSNSEAAELALSRLQVFIEQRSLPAIVTSRLHGFAQLGMQTAGWRVGTLTPFSLEQQRSLAYLWFVHRASATTGTSFDPDAIARIAERETTEFISELRASDDLRDLAAVPLLLSLLVAHRFRNARLPESRFKAYRSLAEHLLSSHPRSRKKAASLADRPLPLSDQDLWRIFALLALRIEVQHSEGMIDEAAASAVCEDLLRDPQRFGFDPPTARQLAKEVLAQGESATGLLTRKSQTDLAFYHRAFQEYFAGVHLAGMTMDQQIAILGEHCADPQWREVILALFFETKREDDVERFVGHIRARGVTALERGAVVSLLGEVAFGDFNCPADLARELAGESFAQIEQGDRMSQRERLLNVALNGLRSARLRGTVQRNLVRWFRRRGWWSQSDLFAEMAKWAPSPDVVGCLTTAMHDEHVSTQRQAARSLADLARGDHEIGNKMASLASRALDPDLRAAAVEGLVRGWQEHESLVAIVEDACVSPAPQLRLSGILGKIKLRIQNEHDLKDLLRLANIAGGLEIWWRDMLVAGLIAGWPGSTVVRDACLKSFHPGREREVEFETAARLLLEGYPQDEAVAELIGLEIDRECRGEVSLLLHEPKSWKLLAENFRDQELIVRRLDAYLPKAGSYRLWEVAQGSLLGRTPTAKAVLLSRLGTHPRHQFVEALLDGWGMMDPEVSGALQRIVYGEPESYGDLSELLPRILGDRTVAQERVMSLYRDSELDGRARCILMGLGDPEQPEDEEVSAAIVIGYARRQQSGKYGFDKLRELFALYPSDPRVREIATQEVMRRNGDYAAVAYAFGQDDTIRAMLIELACPLPAPLRALIARRLREGAGDSEFAFSLLSAYHEEIDDEAMTEGSISYHTLLLESGNEIGAALGKLSQDIVSYGPDYEQRRQAALAGLIVFGRLEVIESVREPAERLEEKRCSVSVLGRFRPNLPLQELLLRNWPYIRRTLGDERWTHLTSGYSHMELPKLWDSYCLLAYDYPEAREEALDFLAREHVASSRVLRFIARAKPRSDLLLDHCLHVLRESSQMHFDFDVADTAAELLGEHFGGDGDVLQRLIADRKLPREEGDLFDSNLIVALCEGWRDDAMLAQVFTTAVKLQPPMSDRTHFQLVCACSDSSFVHTSLLDMIRFAEIDASFRGLPLARPIIRRLQEDCELADMLTAHVTSGPRASEKASIPRILAVARGVPDELRKWCARELADQLEGARFPQVGFDLVSRELRPVAHSLLDVLEAR
jgi:hypothetical protein